MHHKKRKNWIPDRWLDYRAVGKRIPGTRFIAFKVPLKQSLNRYLPCSDVFGPWELLEALGEENQELGLIIDLTFTTRYYQLEDIPESLLCVKILTAGHEIPSDATILSFKQAVYRFLRDNTDNDKLIGVHCTHGLNRTGYLVCRYLIDVEGMDPKKAVELFNSSRGHTIERENYIEDLQSGPKRSNEGMEESELEPMRGRALRRPLYNESDPKDEGQPHMHDCYNLGPSRQRGMSHQSNQWVPQGSRFPALPLPPNPPFPPLMGPTHPPYQWNHRRPDTQWRSPFYLDETRHRYPQPEPEWSSPSHGGGKRRRDHYAPAPPYSAHPCHSPNAFWDNQSHGHNSSEEWAGPKMKPHYRHQHRRRVNAYRNNY
ncbi:RNA/RNP complex-1-interacting phosphatase isoform 1-T2 [Polymixia lowei]